MIEKAAKKIRQMLDAWLERRGYGRADIAVACLFLGVLVGSVATLIPTLVHEAKSVTARGTDTVRSEPPSQDQLNARFQKFMERNEEQWRVGKESEKSLEERVDKHDSALANLKDQLDSIRQPKDLFDKGQTRRLEEFRKKLESLVPKAEQPGKKKPTSGERDDDDGELL